MNFISLAIGKEGSGLMNIFQGIFILLRGCCKGWAESMGPGQV
jgi:hypothetical protein